MPRKGVQAAKEVAPQPEPQPPSLIRLPTSSSNRINRSNRTHVEQPLPPKKPPQKRQRKFDADTVAALLDKRDPRRNAAAGLDPAHALSWAASTEHGGRLSQSEIDALRARLMARTRDPLVGVRDPNELIVNVTVKLRPGGRLAAAPFARSTAEVLRRWPRATARDPRSSDGSSRSICSNQSTMTELEGD